MTSRGNPRIRRLGCGALLAGAAAALLPVGPALAGTHSTHAHSAHPRSTHARTVIRHYQTGCRFDTGIPDCPFLVGVPLGGVVDDTVTTSFAARSTERTVTIDVRDATGLPVAYAVQGGEGRSGEEDIQSFCGPTRFSLAPYSVVDVYVFEVYDDGGSGSPCPAVASVATVGTVTATFRS